MMEAVDIKELNEKIQIVGQKQMVERLLIGLLSKGLVLLCSMPLLIFSYPAFAQKKINDNPAANQQGEYARIMFYNAENLFDIENDSLKNDDDFTPEGNYRWSYYRFEKKLQNIAKVIIGLGGWQPPAIIGLCEIENRYVLNRLTQQTALKNFNYFAIHEESPDRRGIDVALLYRPEQFQVVYHHPYRLVFPFDTTSKTRDILYVKGILMNTDTIHLFVNHWPSKYGGAMETKPKRNYAGTFLRAKTDSIFAVNRKANIIIMGDFNDEPTDESIALHLGVKQDTTEANAPGLVNLMFYARKNGYRGTHRFREQWSFLDQFIISTPLLQQGSQLKISTSLASVFDAGFIMEDDNVYNGKKPFRTFSGPRYLGGFSDHLPIYIDVVVNQ